MKPKNNGTVKKKKDTLRSLKQWLRSTDAKIVLIMIAASILLFLCFCLVNISRRYDLKVGAISRYTINADRDVVDEIATEEKRKSAADAVEPTYRLQEGASEEVMNAVSGVFSEMRTIQQYGLTLRDEGWEAADAAHTFTEEEIGYARSLLGNISLSDYQITTLLRTETADFDTMVSTVELAVRNSLNTTIREGQVSQTTQTILQIVGYRVSTSLYQNVVPTVLRTCIKPNMVIEQTSTEAARQKARDAVEPVVYLQGQCIVREGERVNASQLEMLRNLGVLEDGKIDWSVYEGAAMLVVFGMVLLAMILRLTKKAVLHDLRKMAVILVVIVFNTAMCAVTVKFIDPHLAPVTLAAMLLTGLIGRTAALASSVMMAVMASMMTASGAAAGAVESVQLWLCTIITGTVITVYLKDKPQRVRVVISGFIAAVCNALIIIAATMLRAQKIIVSVDAIGWSALGAVMSGVIAVGLQPVLETIFNLATPSKLLELGNPNHPLLRRLLLEAPGTYHHSIIVANLAEAAAEKIGANPLLARTGAYFHDIGKLKRPLYFKENQLGDNPHDHTDPYVSAAIVTAHTKDGLAMAQRHRLPPELQHIIAEHHGDTPVMFFYHKATQLADGKEIDISDFRYDGPRPTLKEGAIIMLADTVEAAVRSMQDPTPQAIEKNIERLVRGKLDDGQLSNADLTLRDIDGICEAFAKVLVGIFHERIEYPTMEAPKRDVFERQGTTLEQETAAAESEEQEAAEDAH